MPTATVATGSNYSGDESGKQSVLEARGYRTLRTLGEGCFATVKLAYSEKHENNVAVKIINKKLAQHDYLQKFLPRELKIVKDLKHQNLVIFIEAIETNARVYIVMEEATGGDLLSVVRKERRIPEGQAGFWFKQLCDAVEYCHQRGIVHRDLKCENVLLDTKNNIKVVDFGFARADMFPIDGMFIRSSTYCGSYAYAAPEILMNHPYVPQMSDVWSMGVILYILVIGKLPFEDTTLGRLLKSLLAGPFFPEDRESTAEFQEVVKNILKPEETRIGIPEIRKSAWYYTNALGTAEKIVETLFS